VITSFAPIASADLVALIESLTSAGVEFIVIGGAAAVLHGAPTSTLAINVFRQTTRKNKGVFVYIENGVYHVL
jgi:hypothetical protein